MPKIDGIEVIRQLKKKGDPTSILVISAFNDRELILGLSEFGPVECLSKDEVPEKLIGVILKIIAQRQHVSPSQKV